MRNEFIPETILKWASFEEPFEQGKEFNAIFPIDHSDQQESQVFPEPCRQDDDPQQRTGYNNQVMDLFHFMGFNPLFNQITFLKVI
jgi:hypothetical protein